jgi:thioredoxin 1
MSVLEITSDNFEKEVLKSEKTVLVDMYATWCGPCKMQSPIIDKIADEQGENIKVAKIDIDEAPEIAEKYGVMSIPTLLIIKNGGSKESPFFCA